MQESFITQVLSAAVQGKASDVHLKKGKPPILRVDGELHELKSPPLRSSDTTAVISWFCKAAGITPPADDVKQMDFPMEVTELGRFRCHIFKQLGTWAAALRVIPKDIPTPKELLLPPVVNQIAGYERGIVLVTGATGMGKSTTVASILAEMSRNRRSHIVTIEDPVEFIIPDGQASVSQRGIGIDVDNFDQALEASFREDPDVLFIGEMRSRRSVEVAIQAGESGHLCISTFHTADVAKTVARISTMVPEEHRRSLLGRLADNLKAVISQRLLPMEGRRGRILAAEVMVTSPSLREAIRDPAQHKNINPLIAREATGTNNITLDQHLILLVKNKLISTETAKAAASKPGDLMRSLRVG